MFKILSLFFVIAIMLTIFLFSAQTAQDSSKLSGEIVEIVIKIVLPHYDELPEIQQQQIKEKVTLIVRKLAHFTEFAVLGFFLILHLISYNLILWSFEAEEKYILSGLHLTQLMIPVCSLM